MKWLDDALDLFQDAGFWVFLTIAGLVIVATCASCATYTAVVEAPADFWITAEVMLMAVVEDLWTVVEWLL